MSIDKRACMMRAQALVAEGTPESLRYAALELRLCIEALTYERLWSFRSLVPESILRTWQPPQAVRALLEFEPNADRSYTLSVGVEDEYGVPPKEMKVVGHHHALQLAWLRKHYNKLGSFLHAPLIGSDRPHAAGGIGEYLAIVIADLQAPLSDHVIASNIREVISFVCEVCGDMVVNNARTVRERSKATCFNPACGAEYHASVVDQSELAFKLMTTEFECMGNECDALIAIENRKINLGMRLVCPKCGVSHIFVSRQWGYGVENG